MRFGLKRFQTKSLDALREYLDSARLHGAKNAFLRSRGEEIPPGYRLTYREISGLEGVPYICLRLPTGGGKTLLAAYSIPIAGETYLDQEFPATLWFVPSRTIQQQTVDAMKDVSHPYRVALEDAFRGRVRVFDGAEFAHLRPSDLTESACVIVSTLATVRIEDTESRNFYAHNENFESFFRNVPDSNSHLERMENGKTKFSFANLLYLKRPVVIVDEAHNARTSLTFESLARVNPACILEFTATPDRDARTGSNVLFSVSAGELRDAEMIKMPIVLTEHKTWEDAVHAAVVEREILAKISQDSKDCVRPIVLFQAQNKDKDVNVETLVEHLINNEGLERDRIAVATGSQRELENIKLFDSDCKIDYIVTVSALREGWDCSYAYVLCSVVDLRSATAVEQLLGRVLRMPFATRRSAPALNKAYAHVVSRNFVEAAQSLRDRMVEKMGFDNDEFLDAIEEGDRGLFDGQEFDDRRAVHHYTVELTSVPILSALDLRTTVKCEPIVGGRFRVTVTGLLSDESKRGILNAASTKERSSVETAIALNEWIFKRASSPSQRGEVFSIPRLAVPLQGELELAEPQLFLDYANWSLLDYPAEISNFHYDPNTQTYIYDFYDRADGKATLAYKLADEQGEDLLLPGLYVGWNENDLVRWLDRKTRDSSTAQVTLVEWLRRLVKRLISEQHFSIQTLVRAKFILANAIERTISALKQDAVRKGYQELLFGDRPAPETNFKYQFTFDALSYAPNWTYAGSQIFTRHFYPQVGELKSHGEELNCAQVIEGLPELLFWVRNLERRPDSSFWLPTSSDRFYPDFVCKLRDGRFLVVEYKGEVYKTNDDSEEKRQIGKLWADMSAGTCLFLMAVANDNGRDVLKQITDAVGSC